MCFRTRSSICMKQNTKAKAIQKADYMRKFVGYSIWLTSPQRVQEHHAGLQFTNSFFNNIKLMKWNSLKVLSMVGHRVDLSWSDYTD